MAETLMARIARDVSDAGMDLMTYPWFPVLNRDDPARGDALLALRFTLGPDLFRRVVQCVPFPEESACF